MMSEQRVNIQGTRLNKDRSRAVDRIKHRQRHLNASNESQHLQETYVDQLNILRGPAVRRVDNFIQQWKKIVRS